MKYTKVMAVVDKTDARIFKSVKQALKKIPKGIEVDIFGITVDKDGWQHKDRRLVKVCL